VTLTCAPTGTAPAGVTCTPPAAFSLTTSAVTQNVAFTTTPLLKTTSGLSLATGNRSPWRSPWTSTLTFAMAGLLMLFASRSRRLGKLTLRGAGLFTLLLAICIPTVGCIKDKPTNPTATLAGTYNYTVTATSGTITHAETVTLTVN
jgi:hypothetical protein